MEGVKSRTFEVLDCLVQGLHWGKADVRDVPWIASCHRRNRMAKRNRIWIGLERELGGHELP